MKFKFNQHMQNLLAAFFLYLSRKFLVVIQNPRKAHSNEKYVP